MPSVVSAGSGSGRGKSRVEAIGVDLGTHLIKLLRVRALGDRAEVDCWGTVPTPEGAIENGLIRDSEKVAYALRRLVTGHDLIGGEACTAVPASCLTVECHSIGVASSQSPDAAAKAAMAERWGVPDEEQVRTCSVIEEGDDGEAVTVALASAPAAVVHGRAEVLARARLRPVALDLEAFALMTSLVDCVDDPLRNGAFALVDLGGSTFDVVAVASRRFLGVRSVPAPPEEAGIGAAVASAIAALREEQAADAEWEPQRLTLCGGGADSDVAITSVGEATGLPVERGEVFSGGRLFAGDGAAFDAGRHGPLLAVAAGLALRGPLLSGRLKGAESA